MYQVEPLTKAFWTQ